MLAAAATALAGTTAPRVAAAAVVAAAARPPLLRRRQTTWPVTSLRILPRTPPTPQLCVRHDYPPAAFDLLASYFPGSKQEHPPLAISVAQTLCAGDASCAAGLRRAGFDVVPLVLKRQRALAAAGPHRQHDSSTHGGLGSCGQPHGGGGGAAAVQQPPLADVVAFCDSLHLLDPRRALQAARRHVHPQGGLLAALWADRDLSSALVLGLEELLERHLPAYHRYSEQHDMPDWAPRLQLGGHFRMVDFSAFHHSITIPSYGALLDSLNARGALHAALGSSGRRAFHGGLRRLVDEHSGTGDGPMQLPMLTKMYLLAAAGGSGGRGAAQAARALGSAAPAAARAGGGSTCMFCGAAVPAS